MPTPRMLGHMNYVRARETLPDVPDHPPANLTQRQLSIYMAALTDGFTYREIAEDFNITPQRVYQIVHMVAAAIRRQCPVYRED